MLFIHKDAMQEAATPTVNNLKVHIILTSTGVQHLKTSLLYESRKNFNNFSVVRQGWTYIIFANRGFVNITGINSYSQIESVIPQFCAAFKLDRAHVASDVVVDNISANGDFGKRCNLALLQRLLNKRGGEEERKYFTITFDRNFFPGAFCKTRGFGTLTLFPSGKFVLVGAKCLEHVEKTFLQMRAVIAIL